MAMMSLFCAFDDTRTHPAGEEDSSPVIDLFPCGEAGVKPAVTPDILLQKRLVKSTGTDRALSN
jgi:hypothetical protein